MAGKHYLLTARAAADLREARRWSLARWGKVLTDRYFDDLHAAAQHIAENQESLRSRDELTAGTALLLYPVREHYIVYEPLSDRLIALVAVIRQERDVPAILQKWAAPIRRELADIRAAIRNGEIVMPTQQSSSVPRKK